MTSGYVHIGLGWLFAPGWGGAVGRGWAVLGTITELRGDAADTGCVRTSSSTSTRAYGGARHAPTDPPKTILAAQ